MDTAVKLPGEFIDRMRFILQEEFEDFLASYNNDNYKGLRINALKKVNKDSLPFELKSIPWCETGFYYESCFPGKHIYHDMGLYYIQEPSAMSVVEELDIQKGDYVLDLCAAPGGKSTQIAMKLDGTGLLVSNEIIPSRAKTLSSNIERMGVSNCVVTNESPDSLKKHFKKFFNKILVDAPCSGEGMFKKNPIALDEWSVENVQMCKDRQIDILKAAREMLADGGMIVFSTCTFSYDENETVVDSFLKDNPTFEVLDSKNKFSEGRYDLVPSKNESIKKCQRIYPHKVKGEGHFFAVLKDTCALHLNNVQTKAIKVPKEYLEFMAKSLNCEILPNLMFGDNLYFAPYQKLDGIKVLRAGLHLGELKKNRFEPSHSLALALCKNDFKNIVEVTCDSSITKKYLIGESFETSIRGWGVIIVDGYPLGWFKGDGQLGKNHYPKGLRREL